MFSGYDLAGDIQNRAELVSDLNELGVRNGGSSLAAYWPARKEEFAKFITAQCGRVEIGTIERPAPAKKKPAR